MKMKHLPRIIAMILFGIALLPIAKSQDMDSIYYQDRSATDTISKILLIAEYRENSMWLRWAPNKSSDWRQLNETGYVITKVPLDDYIPDIENRDSIDVNPWEKEMFRPYISSEKKEILVVGESIHGQYQEAEPGMGDLGAEENNRYSFCLFAADMDWEAAEAAGLAWEDKNVILGKRYLYRVESKDTSLEVIEGFTTEVAEENALPTVSIKNAIQGEDKITLQWDRSLHEGKFSAYYIESSVDKNYWTKVSETPFVGGVTEDFESPLMSYTINIDNFDAKYYRVIGVTPFARLCPPSQEVLLKGRDKTPCDTPTNLEVSTNAETKRIDISWDAVNCSDLTGYKVYKSFDVEGPFSEVSYSLKNQPTKYSVTTTNTEQYAYYAVSSVDTAGNESRTLPYIAIFRDTIPPTPPTGLSGSIDSTGAVVLSWNENPESDLHGYQVYMSNQADHKYTLLTGHALPTPVYHDTITLKTLTEDIYYKVVAMDHAGAVSDFSDPIILSRPDTIAPMPPVITDYKIKQDHILLQMTPSRSKDVLAQVLERSIYGTDQWEVIYTLPAQQSTYTDAEVANGKSYEYRVKAIDEAGNESPMARSMKIKYVQIDKLVSISNVKVSLDNTSESAIITWTPADRTDIKHYVVYRSVKGSPMTILKNVGKQLTYTDDKFTEGQDIKYAVRYSTTQSKRSKLSEWVSAE